MKHNGIIREYSAGIGIAIRIADVCAVVLAGLAAFYIRFHQSPVIAGYLVLIILVGMAVPLLFSLLGIYSSWRTRSLFAPIARILGIWVFLFALIAVTLVLFHQAERYSRLWMFIWFVLGSIELIGTRIVLLDVLRFLRRRGWNTRVVAIVGSGPLVQRLMSTVQSADWMGLVVAGVFYDKDFKEVPDVPHYDLQTLKDWTEGSRVDEVWIALPINESQLIHEVFELLSQSCVTVRYVPDLFELVLLNHGMTDVAGLPMIDLTASPMQGVDRLLKELEDKILATIVLLVICPLMLLIALGIKLTSRGPVFYKQERVGWNGNRFKMYKFRSMVMNAESRTGAVWAVKDDGRTTGFGAFLRHTSLDEIPQFINVLKGDMSIVGPRPERPVFVDKFKEEIPGYMQKHLVKAGITGWAQVNGWRGQTDLNKRIEYDLYYIKNWSLLFDFKIILLTLFKGFVHENAY